MNDRNKIHIGNYEREIALTEQLLRSPAVLLYLFFWLACFLAVVAQVLFPRVEIISLPVPTGVACGQFIFFPLLTLGFVYYQGIRFPSGINRIEVPVRRSNLEGFAAFLLYGLWVFFLSRKLLTDWYPLPFIHTIGNFLEGLDFISAWAATTVEVFLELVLLQLLPTVLIFLVIFRYGWRDFGIRWHFLWTVGVVLMVILAGFFLLGKEPEASLQYRIGASLLQLVAVVFPEEFFYRGVLQTRMERLFINPLNGIVVAGVLFGLAHYPHLYFEGYTQFQALITSLFYQGNAGLFLGLVYYHIRHLGPVIFLHLLLNIIFL